MSPNGHPDPTGELGNKATAETKKLLGPDHESVPLGCAVGIFFAILAISVACLGFTGSSGTSSASSGSRTTTPSGQALGKLPELDVTKPAAPPTTTTTAAPAPEPEAPAIVVPGPQQGSGQPSGGGGGGGGAPAPAPPPAEVCSLSGSASVSGAKSGGLGPSGGQFVAGGPSSVTVSGYPLCHRYRIQVSWGNGGFANGCFLTDQTLNLATNDGDSVSVTISTPPNGC